MSSSRDDFSIAIRSALLQRGARQKFSLFFLICLSILIFFLDSFPNKAITNLKSFLNDGIYRSGAVASSPIKFFKFIVSGIESHFLIYNKNKLLKIEIDNLKSKKFNFEFLSAENTKLKEILKSSDVAGSSYIIAKVLLDKKSPFLKSIILNRGSNSGIKRGMPVLDHEYLVGRIIEVNFLSSRALLLNDLNSKLPVLIEPLAEQAILGGAGEDNPILYYLPEIFKSVQASTVFTSGKDGIFPSGIPIGKLIVETETNKTNVKLFSDHNQLSYVKILIDKFKETNF